MRLRGKLILVLAVALCIGGFFVLSRNREPEYEGKKLSAWVRWLPSTYGPTPPGVFLYPWAKDAERSTEAILQIGTNAIPYLLVWIQYEVPGWRTKVQKTRWFPQVLKQRLLRDDKFVLQQGASRAFHILGPSASGAVRTLNEIMNDPQRDTQVAGCCALALADIGFDALPAFLGGLTNKQSQVQYIVSHRLPSLVPADMRVWQPGQRLTAGDRAVSSLLSLLHHPRQDIREGATNALRAIKPQALERGGG